MNRNDRQAIERLFAKLAEVEAASPARDGEAEAFIRSRAEQQPGAPYYMAQTIVVQEQALEAAQDRINELEAQLDDVPSSSGGLLGGFFGGSRLGSTSVPRAGSRRAGAHAAPGRRDHGGGGFLAGAAQTAMGVTGGVLLGNMLAGMLAGGAEASEAAAGEGEEEPDAGLDDAGGFEDPDI